MSSKKGKETTRNAEISREQMELLTTEKELKALLKKINEHNNQLLVSLVFFYLIAKGLHTFDIQSLRH